MKELTVADAVKVALEQQGVCLQTWISDHLHANGFDLQRPIHYRYHTGLQVTRIYQYEYGADLPREQQDFDADFLDTEAWDRACELLVQDMEQHAHEEAPRGKQ